MNGRISLLLTCMVLTAAPNIATAMELDTLLPTDIPGYGVPKDISVLDRPHPDYVPVDIDVGGVSIDPKLQAQAGYDTLPGGLAPGSTVLDLDPSVTALDSTLGLGAYLGGSFANYAQAPRQNLSGYTVALGERAVLPRETLTFGAAIVSTQETGFGLDTVPVEKPIGVRVETIRGSDALILGTLTLTPEFSATHYRFSKYRGQNRTDLRQSLTSELAPGGPARFVVLLHATESTYLDRVFNANTYSLLAGVADEATGIWNIRLLAGGAERQPLTGSPVTAPVLEASLGWMPGDLDSVKLDASREIDDPDQESAGGYTLTATDLSIAHEYLRNVILTAGFGFSHAAYFNSKQVESLYAANASINWHLNRALALNASYAFNDRQANYLRAANQHIFTLGVTWSP